LATADIDGIVQELVLQHVTSLESTTPPKIRNSPHTRIRETAPPHVTVTEFV
jgi:hypothetical protein